MEKKLLLWQKSYLFINIISFQFNTLSRTIFQHFDASLEIRFVKASKIDNGFPFELFIWSKSLSLEPYLWVWEQMKVPGGRIWKIRWVGNQSEALCIDFAIAFIDFWVGAFPFQRVKNNMRLESQKTDDISFPANIICCAFCGSS